MAMRICASPVSWGLNGPSPDNPTWESVLDDACSAGYQGMEFPALWFFPSDSSLLAEAMKKRNLSFVAASIFTDLVDPDNIPKIKDEIGKTLEYLADEKMPRLPKLEGQKYGPLYVTVMDFGHDERDFAAGHYDFAPRLPEEQWEITMNNVRELCGFIRDCGARPVIHPHAGGYFEFADEIASIVEHIPYELAGLCLDTGHLYYSGMDPAGTLKQYRDRLDYVHFKDVNQDVYTRVMNGHMRFFDGVCIGTMCPIGTGALNYIEIRKVLEEIGYNGYITLEQERDNKSVASVLTDITRSAEYLLDRGFTF